MPRYAGQPNTPWRCDEGKTVLDVPRINKRRQVFCKLKGLQVPIHIAKHWALLQWSVDMPGITKATLTHMTHKVQRSNNSGWNVMARRKHITNGKRGFFSIGPNMKAGLKAGLIIKRCQEKNCIQCSVLFGQAYACGDVLPPFAEWSHCTFPDAREAYELATEDIRRQRAHEDRDGPYSENWSPAPSAKEAAETRLAAGNIEGDLHDEDDDDDDDDNDDVDGDGDGGDDDNDGGHGTSRSKKRNTPEKKSKASGGRGRVSGRGGRGGRGRGPGARSSGDGARGKRRKV